MTPFEADPTAQWTRQIQDTLAGNSGMREGLLDDEALPLVNWGAEQAETVAQRLAQESASPPDAEQVALAAHNLGRLLTRITWVVTYRAKKDAAWLTRTFAKINALSQEVFGPDAPTLSDEEIAAWIAEQPGKSNGELILDLLARLTPAGAAPATAESPEAPATLSGETPEAAESPETPIEPSSETSDAAEPPIDPLTTGPDEPTGSPPTEGFEDV